MKDFWKGFFGVSILWSAAGWVLASVAAVFRGPAEWTAGIWACGAWLLVNHYLIYKIVGMVRRGGEIQRRKIYALSLVKFPVLYLGGLGLLLLPWVHPEGVLIAFSVYLPVVVVFWFRSKSSR